MLNKDKYRRSNDSNKNHDSTIDEEKKAM
jgi:hypothetical protein